MKHFYKVKYGFKASDFISIEAGADLEKTIYAWQTGGIAQIGDKMISGNNIISIEPHFHRYTGWHESYEPRDGNDYAQIERDCPKFDGVLTHYRDRVTHLMRNNRKEEIGKNREPYMIQSPH